MIEILNIILQFFIFLILFNFPFTERTLCSFLNLKKNLINYYDVQAVNIIFFIFLSLFFSFLNVDIVILFKFHLFICVIFLITHLKKLEIKFDREAFEKILYFFIISFSLFFFIAQNLKLEWDGHHWIEKTLIFYNGLNINELTNVRTNPDYPHLGSFIWAYFWKNSLLEIEYFGRYFQVYFYIISVFVCLNIVKIKHHKIKLLITFFILLITFDLYLFSGYQEYLIFAALLISLRFVMLLNFLKPNIKVYFLITIIFYSLSWFKNEGLVYFVIFNFSLLIFLKLNFKEKLLLIFFSISLILLQFFLQKNIIGIYGLHHSVSINDILQDIINLKILYKKISLIFLHFLISFIKYPVWILIFLSLFWIIFAFKKIELFHRYFLSCLLLNFIFIIFIFFNFKNFDFMLKVSLDRLLFQTSGFYLIFFLTCIKKNLESSKSKFL